MMMMKITDSQEAIWPNPKFNISCSNLISRVQQVWNWRKNKTKPVQYHTSTRYSSKYQNIAMSTPFITSTGSKATNQKQYNYDLYRSMWKEKFVACCRVQYQQLAG